jgi:hypothetical protein
MKATRSMTRSATGTAAIADTTRAFSLVWVWGGSVRTRAEVL